MAREIEAPNIGEDQESLAERGIIEISRMRADQLPAIIAEHAGKSKRLLKEAAKRLNQLDIFPTVELVRYVGEDEKEAVPKKLLFVTTDFENSDTSTEFFLNPEGELIAHFKIGDQTLITSSDVLDKDYVRHTAHALLAAERRIRDSIRKSDDRPRLTLLKGGAQEEFVPHG